MDADAPRRCRALRGTLLLLALLACRSPEERTVGEAPVLPPPELVLEGAGLVRVEGRTFRLEQPSEVGELAAWLRERREHGDGLPLLVESRPAATMGEVQILMLLLERVGLEDYQLRRGG